MALVIKHKITFIRIYCLFFDAQPFVNFMQFLIDVILQS